MSKRKYTRFGENPVAYECSKKKCKWQGSDKEWVQKSNDPEYPSSTESTCPKCGNNEFYGLLEMAEPKTHKIETIADMYAVVNADNAENFITDFIGVVQSWLIVKAADPKGDMKHKSLQWIDDGKHEITVELCAKTQTK